MAYESSIFSTLVIFPGVFGTRYDNKRFVMWSNFSMWKMLFSHLFPKYTPKKHAWLEHTRCCRCNKHQLLNKFHWSREIPQTELWNPNMQRKPGRIVTEIQDGQSSFCSLIDWLLEKNHSSFKKIIEETKREEKSKLIFFSLSLNAIINCSRSALVLANLSVNHFLPECGKNKKRC